MMFLKLNFSRPLEFDSVIEMLTHIASLCPQIPFIYEVRGCQKQISYYLGADRGHIRILVDAMKAHGDIRFAEVLPSERMPVTVAKQLKISKSKLVLNTDFTDTVTRAGLSALVQPNGSEQSVLQIAFSSPYSPSPMPSMLQDPHASWLKLAFGNVEKATTEARNAVKEKIGTHGFHVAVRLGATGNRAEAHILTLLSALRTLESAGVTIQATPEDPHKLNTAVIPRSSSLRLSVAELGNLMLLPAGKLELPGVPGLHPRQVMPPEWYQNPATPAHDRTFAISPDNKTRLSIPLKDSLRHTYLIGSTGCGKSTVMQHLFLRDAYASKNLMLVDAKGDLYNAVLERYPRHRDEDLALIDLSSDTPVSINPLAVTNGRTPGLVADSVLSSFRQIYDTSWGVYSQDILSHALNTLAHEKGATLLWLVPLLTDEAFRRKITARITDKVGLGEFWASFESMGEAQRNLRIEPVLNKLRQILLRSSLRYVLGNGNPRFSLDELFTRPRIVLINLNKGIASPDAVKLMGGLVLAQLWSLALSRVNVPEGKRRIVGIYIDEFHDFIGSIAEDFSHTLAMGRGLGLGFCMTNQFLEQLPKDIRAGIEANVHSKIVFNLMASDAKAMAALAPDLEAVDFQTLPQYNIYTSFLHNGRNTGWISGKTLPETKPIRSRAELQKMVASRYGKPGKEIEQEYLDIVLRHHTNSVPGTDFGAIGRRAKP